jgi:hypothetical protein
MTKFSELAVVDEALFKGRKPSNELVDTRNKWTREFEKRLCKN